jgi:hypothetical protein
VAAFLAAAKNTYPRPQNCTYNPSTAPHEGPCSYRSVMGRAGGAEPKVPETFDSASSEGSTRGASPCGMSLRWDSGLERGRTRRVDESGFVTAARGAEEAPKNYIARVRLQRPAPSR